MKKLHFIACDDEFEALNIMCSAIEYSFQSHGYDVEIDTYTDPVRMFETLDDETKAADILFLDIKIMDKYGIGTIRKKFPNLNIVFFSNKEDKVPEYLDVKPLAFIRKNNLINDVVNLYSAFKNLKSK